MADTIQLDRDQAVLIVMELRRYSDALMDVNHIRAEKVSDLADQLTDLLTEEI